MEKLHEFGGQFVAERKRGTSGARRSTRASKVLGEGAEDGFELVRGFRASELQTVGEALGEGGRLGEFDLAQVEGVARFRGAVAEKAADGGARWGDGG